MSWAILSQCGCVWHCVATTSRHLRLLWSTSQREHLRYGWRIVTPAWFRCAVIMKADFLVYLTMFQRNLGKKYWKKRLPTQGADGKVLVSPDVLHYFEVGISPLVVCSCTWLATTFVRMPSYWSGCMWWQCECHGKTPRRCRQTSGRSDC